MYDTIDEDFDHSRTIAGDDVCEAVEGQHECDLVKRHVAHGSRHMCVCGRYFD